MSITEIKDKKVPDWNQIENDYRAGVKSLRVIAEEQGVPHTNIHRKAKKLGWTQDLAKRVADDRRRRLADAAATELGQQDTVEASAEMQANVITAHRDDIKAIRELFGENLEALKEVDGVRDKIDLTEKSSKTLRTIISMEREAYGIGEELDQDVTHEDMLAWFDANADVH
jgi:DNA-binding cell septation regulator SpoVG